MAFVYPSSIQDPTTNVIALATWGDAVNAAMNWLRAAKAGCLLTTNVATAVGTDTAIPFATETFDVNACHDTGANTSRITVPTNWAGLWLVGANVVCASDQFVAHIRVDGTTKIVGQSSNTSGATNSGTTLETVYDMNVAQYFEVVVTGGTNLDNGATLTRFWAYWLAGPAT